MSQAGIKTTSKTSYVWLPFIFLGVLILLCVWWFSSSLKSLPGDAEPQSPFDFGRALGNWYEIARLENDLEEGFGQATLKVVKASEDKLQLTLADSKTKKAISFEFEYDADKKVGSAYVPCWGPFFCGYHVIASDKKDFSWMMVAGHTLDELWLFARAPSLSPDTLKIILAEAEALGYDPSLLVINNRPAENKVQPPSPSMKEVPSYPDAPVPYTPANEPPSPLYIPAVPTKIPEIPKDIPPIPRDIPQFGKPATIPDPIIPETPAVKQRSSGSKKSTADR
jgi:apolipoprotein D and lipocalin family protein